MPYSERRWYSKILYSLVFVHGLNGHPERTWTDQDTRFFWPRDIHREIDGIRVVTFGYPAGVEWSLSRNLMGIHDHAVDLLTSLRNERDSTSVVRLLFPFYRMS
jgi:hypothetical protein